MTSALGGFYTFTPLWGGFFTAFVLFGLGLGSLAMLLRTRSDLLQFIIGTVVATGAELLNEFDLLPILSWEFAPGWPFGISNPLLRALVLGLAGGFFLLIVNFLARSLYKRRLRMG